MSGPTDFTASTIAPHVEAGKLVPFVTLNAARSTLFPDLLTVS